MKLRTVRQKTPKPSKALARGGVRPTLEGAMLKIEERPEPDRPEGIAPNHDAVIYATNSYMFIRHVITDLTREDIKAAHEGPIPGIALAHIEKGIHFTPGEAGVEVGLATYQRRLSEQSANTDFPRWESLQPPESKKPFRVCLNAGLMKDLADALGDEQLIFEFDQESFTGGDDATYLKPIRVKTSNREDGEALLMPVRLREG